MLRYITQKKAPQSSSKRTWNFMASHKIFFRLAAHGIISAGLLSFIDYPVDPTGRIPRDSDPTPNEITTDAGPRVLKGTNVFFSADFTYWYAKQEGLGYSQSGYVVGGQNPKQGRVHDINFGYEPGFKVGVGLNLREDGWEALAQYTWNYQHASRGIRDAGATLHPTWFILNEISYKTDLEKAFGSWHLHFNVIDIELARNFFVSRYASLRPFIGLKGTWQQQDYRVEYLNKNLLYSKMNMHQKYWAFGPRGGVDMRYYFNPSWSVYGNGAVSLIWGEFSLHRRDRTRTANALENTNPVNQMNDIHSLKAVIELGLGLSWDTWTYDYRYHFQLQLGWEQQLWISHNQYIRTFEECAHGDLILQGIVAKGRFDF